MECALYARDREAVWSCVELAYMRYGSLYALVSAAHVFDNGGERWIGGEHSRVSLSGVFRTGGNRNAPPPLRELDLAIVPLSRGLSLLYLKRDS